MKRSPVLPQSSPDTAGCAPVAYATRGHFLVSNPCCSPRFRTSASVVTQRAAFAVGVPFSIYEFYLYTGNSTLLYHTQVDPHSGCSMGKPWNSSREIGTPPTCPLRPVIPENACTPCLRLVRGFPRGSDYAFSSPPNLGNRKYQLYGISHLISSTFIKKKSHRPYSGTLSDVKMSIHFRTLFIRLTKSVWRGSSLRAHTPSRPTGARLSALWSSECHTRR